MDSDVGGGMDVDSDEGGGMDVDSDEGRGMDVDSDEGGEMMWTVMKVEGWMWTVCLVVTTFLHLMGPHLELRKTLVEMSLWIFIKSSLPII